MIETWAAWLADGLVAAGLLVLIVAVYGAVWLPDTYLRLHAASKAAFLGVLPILLAAALTGERAIVGRVCLVAALLILTTPVSSHAIGRAAYHAREPMHPPDAVDELQGK